MMSSVAILPRWYILVQRSGFCLMSMVLGCLSELGFLGFCCWLLGFWFVVWVCLYVHYHVAVFRWVSSPCAFSGAQGRLRLAA